MELAGKVALVTGAGAGIGRATALRLSGEGARVVVADLEPEAGGDTVTEIAGAGGRASFVRADVTSEEDVRATIAEAESTCGGLDVLVNNAGGYEQPVFPEAPVEHWTRNLDLNLRGVMLAIHYGVRALERRGGGAIVNVASVAGLGYGPYEGPEYAAAKAGVMRLTSSLATLADRVDVRVNCVCPDWVGTPAVRRSIEAMSPEERTSVPPVLLEPEEIADAVVQLVRDDALAGRVLICRCGEPRYLVPTDRRE